MTYEEAKALVDADTKRLVEKWNKTGLLDGIKDDLTPCTMSIIIESQEKSYPMPPPTEEGLKLEEAMRIVHERAELDESKRLTAEGKLPSGLIFDQPIKLPSGQIITFP